MDKQSMSTKKITLMRVAAWGQAIGFLAMSAFVIADPSSISLDSGDLVTLLVVFVVVGAVSTPRMAKFLADAFSSISISLFVIAMSFATLLTAIAGVSLSFSIPDVLVTDAWQYTRTTSLITLAIFLTAFIINSVLSIQLIRADLTIDAVEDRL